MVSDLRNISFGISHVAYGHVARKLIIKCVFDFEHMQPKATFW